jgi:cytochrome P450/NADPH-cytochrome P450 reductase
MVMAMLLQNFNFQLDDPSYNLRIKQTLTIKPLGLKMRSSLRHGMNATDIERFLHESPVSTRPNVQTKKPVSGARTPAKSSVLTILYGSNTGTCKTFADRLALNATVHGFEAVVKDMDLCTDQLPKSQPVIVVTASYEGQPPDNAARFVGWLHTLDAKALKNVQYAVFGCGHSKFVISSLGIVVIISPGDWRGTFQRIPTLVDDSMASCGASRLVPRGLTDASKGNMLGDFEDWVEQILWPALDKEGPSGPTQETSKPMFDVEVCPPVDTFSLRQDVEVATVMDARKMTGPGEPPKHHLEIELPEQMTYECGDYLAVLPMNSEEVVQRIMKRFNIEQDSIMVVRGQKLGLCPLTHRY